MCARCLSMSNSYVNVSFTGSSLRYHWVVFISIWTKLFVFELKFCFLKYKETNSIIWTTANLTRHSLRRSKWMQWIHLINMLFLCSVSFCTCMNVSFHPLLAQFLIFYFFVNAHFFISSILKLCSILYFIVHFMSE